MVGNASLRRMIPLAISIALAMLVFPLAMPKAAYADPIEFQEGSSFTFESAEDANAWFFTKGDSIIATAVSSDETVATISHIDGGILVIEPVGEGKAIITVTSTDASSTTIEIIVTETYINRCLKNSSEILNHWYGNKIVEVYSQPGTKCTLKIGKEKRSFKMGSKGTKTIKLKKIYKLGTKISCTFKKGKYHATYKSKIFGATGFDIVQAKKKTVRVDCYELHKGDVVKLTYKGKTYTKKIKKNKPHLSVKFSVKKKVAKNAKMKIVITNKFKQKLYYESIQLNNWWYEMPDEDLSEDDYVEE